MDKEQAISFVSYYGAAIPRAFWVSWDWIISQGVLAGLLLAICILAAEGMIVLAAKRSDVAESPGNWWKRYGYPTLRATGCGLILFVAVVFGIFFVRDAPTQLNNTNIKIDNWKTAWEKQAIEDKKALSFSISNRDDEILKLRAQIHNLTTSFPYSVSVDDVVYGYDTQNKTNMFEIRLVIANHISAVQHFRLRSVKLEYPGVKIINYPVDDRDYKLQPGGNTTYYPSVGLSNKEFLELRGHPAYAKLDCVLIYGVIGSQYSRTLDVMFGLLGSRR